MTMTNPNIEKIDQLKDYYPEGTPFILDGIRTVSVKTRDYGDGEMVILAIRGHERELSVWGSYLTVQAKSVEPQDLGKWYCLQRRVIPGFGKGSAVKVLDPVNPGATDPADSEKAPF